LINRYKNIYSISTTSTIFLLTFTILT